MSTLHTSHDLHDARFYEIPIRDSTHASGRSPGPDAGVRGVWHMCMHMCDVHVHVHVHVHVAWRGALWRAPGAGSRVRVWGDVRARDTTYEIRDSLKDGGGRY